MDYVALALVVFVIGITPGPNNIVLMRVAAQRGAAAAAAAIAAVLLGGVALLVAVYLGVRGLGALAWIDPRWMAWAGAIYLLVLGVQLMRTRHASADMPAGHPDGFWSLLLFQLVNPKAWTFMLTLVAAGSGSDRIAPVLPVLLAVFLPVSLLCATTWAAAGHVIARVLQTPAHRARFDAGMGLVLCAYAIYLPIQSGLPAWT